MLSRDIEQSDHLSLSRSVCGDPLHSPPQRRSVVAENGTMCDRLTTW